MITGKTLEDAALIALIVGLGMMFACIGILEVDIDPSRSIIVASCVVGLLIAIAITSPHGLCH